MNKISDAEIMTLLKEQWQLLQKAKDGLQKSYDKCSKFIGKHSYSFEEQESLDSLSSKFNRLSDLYTQKCLRTIWMLLHEPFLPTIDFFNKLEKYEIITSADLLIEIRDLRNRIAHEYIPEALNEIIPDVLSYCSILFDMITCTENYCNKRGCEV